MLPKSATGNEGNDAILSSARRSAFWGGASALTLAQPRILRKNYPDPRPKFADTHFTVSCGEDFRRLKFITFFIVLALVKYDFIRRILTLFFLQLRPFLPQVPVELHR